MPVTIYRPARHIQHQAQLRIKRLLARPGEVVVQAGRTVAPDDLVARRARRYELRAIPVSRMLRVPPKEVPKHLTCRPGQRVERQEVLAERKALLFRRRVVAPTEGVVLGLLDGQLLLQRTLEEERVVAGLQGEVEETLPPYGASILAYGVFLEGVWGNGRTDVGTLVLLPEWFHTPLNQEHFNLELRGAVVAGLTVTDANALEQARSVAVQGLLVAHLPPRLLETARAMPYPILVLEGFRDEPFPPAARQLLEALDRQDVVLCADPPRRDLGTWPWLFVPREAHQVATPVREGEPLQPGTRVRILRGPHRGREAQVEDLESSPYVLPSGFQGYVVKLRLDQEVVHVPLTNVEVIG